MTLSNAQVLSQYASITTTAAEYGADPTGVLDSATAIQNAINAVQTLGGGTVFCADGTYKISAQLNITASNTILVGNGSGNWADAGTAQPAACQFLWAGGTAFSSAMVNIASPVNVTGNRITSNGVQGIQLNCNSGAGFGLQLVSTVKGRYEDLLVLNPITSAYKFTTLTNGQLAGATDTQHNHFDRCLWRCLDTVASKAAHGMWLTSANVLSGSQGNTSLNTFDLCYGQNSGAIGSGNCIRIDDGDNNRFFGFVGYRANTVVSAIQLIGSNASCDANYFFSFSDTQATNAVTVQGTASGFAYNPIMNCFFCADQLNGIPYPTLDAGCRVFWHNSNGTLIYPIGLGMTFGSTNNEAGALAQIANVVGTSRSMLIHNTASAHQIFTDGTNIYNVSLDGSGNLQFNPVAGAGTSVNSKGLPFRSASNVAPPAGGSSACGVQISSTANLGVYTGSGAPTFSAAQGSMYLRTDGSSTSTRAYINTNGSTTWTAVTTAA